MIRGIVVKVSRCDLGFDARAEHEDGLVAAVQEAHGMALSRDEAPPLAFLAELDAAVPSQ